MARKQAGGGREPPSPAATVGYCRPPVHTQFRAGQSGNPAGRPRGSPNFKTEMREALATEVEVVIDGRPQRISKFRVVLEKLMSSASKGDFKAAALIVDLAQTVDNDASPATTDQTDLTLDDREILARYANKMAPKKVDDGGRK
jgi:hypothetical protein